MVIPRKRQIKIQQPQLTPKEKEIALLRIQQQAQMYKDCSKLTNLMKVELVINNENPTRFRNTTTDDITTYQTINNSTSDKTIVNVFESTYGFGDYLRGCITLAHYAKYFGVNFKMCMNNNHIFNYLDNSEQHISHSIDNVEPFWSDNNPHSNIYFNLYRRFVKFMKSDQKILYVESNMLYGMKIPSQDIKNLINSSIIFKSEYYEMAEQLLNLEKYNVIHIRTSDVAFHSELPNNKVIILFREIEKLQLGTNTIVISTNNLLKQKIHKTFGYYFIDKPSAHSAYVKNYNNLESTVLEYIILSKSSHTYAFSPYGHGSGFSEQCSVLNNIPYQVTYVNI